MENMSANIPETAIHYYEYVSNQIWLVCAPLLLIVGTVGNVLSVIVMTRKNLWNTNTRRYLIVLAVVDIACLYVGVVRYWATSVYKYDLQDAHWFLCKIYVWVQYFLMDMTVWVLTIFTIERALSVYWPHRIKAICAGRSPFVILAVCALVLLILNCHGLYGNVYKLKDEKDSVSHPDINFSIRNSGYNGSAVEIDRTEEYVCDYISSEYKHFYFLEWAWLHLSVFCVIPVCLVVVSNAIITYKYRERLQSFLSHDFGESTSSVRLSSLTMMMTLLNFCLVLTTLPYSIVFLMRIKSAFRTLSPREEAELKLTLTVTRVLMFTNSTVNFFLYCLSGSRFRHELRDMLCSKRIISPQTIVLSGRRQQSSDIQPTPSTAAMSATDGTLLSRKSEKYDK